MSFGAEVIFIHFLVSVGFLCKHCMSPACLSTLSCTMDVCLGNHLQLRWLSSEAGLEQFCSAQVKFALCCLSFPFLLKKQENKNLLCLGSSPFCSAQEKRKRDPVEDVPAHCFGVGLIWCSKTLSKLFYDFKWIHLRLLGWHFVFLGAFFDSFWFKQGECDLVLNESKSG